MSLVVIDQLPAPPGYFGLDKYNKSLFPSTSCTFEIPVKNGRYLLGMTDEQEEEFARYFTSKSKDSDEWKEWLSKRTFSVGSEQKILSLDRMEDKFDYHVFIKANPQTNFIAKDKKSAEEAIGNYKFVVVNQELEIEDEVSTIKAKNKGRAALTDIQDDDKELLKLAHYLFPVKGVTNGLIAYKNLETYISQSKENALNFLSLLKEDPDKILVTVSVKRAVEKNIIRRGQDQWYYNHISGTRLGKSLEDTIKYLLDPKNQDELGTGTKDDSPVTILSQLRSKF